MTDYYFWEYLGRGSPIVVTSGYRCPTKNANLNPPGARNSRHVYGDGVDIKPSVLDKCAEMSNVLQAAQLANASFTDTYSDCHVHADWRSWY